MSNSRARSYRFAQLHVQDATRLLVSTRRELDEAAGKRNGQLSGRASEAALDFMGALLTFDQVLRELRAAVVRAVPEPLPPRATMPVADEATT